MSRFADRFGRSQNSVLAGLVFFAPLFIWTGSLLNVDAKFFLVRILIVFICLLQLAVAMLSGKIHLLHFPIPVLSVIFCLVALGAGLANPYSEIGAIWDTGAMLAFFLVAIPLTCNPVFVRRLLSVWMSCAAVVCCYYLLQRLGFDPIKGFYPVRAFYGSTFGNRNYMAFYLVATFPFSLYLSMDAKGVFKILYVAVSLLISGALVVSGSRAGLGVLAVLVPACLWYLLRRGQPCRIVPAKQIAFLITIAGPILGCAFTWFKSASNVDERLDLLARLNQFSHGRVGIWMDAWTMIAANPWFGHGPGSFEKVFPIYRTTELGYSFGFYEPVFSSHNVSLDIISEVGMVGWLTFLTLILFATGLPAYRQKTVSRNRDRAFFSGISLVGCGIFSMTGEIIHVMFCTIFSWLSLAIFYNSVSGRFRSWRIPVALGWSRLPIVFVGVVLAAVVLISFGRRLFASVEVRKAWDIVTSGPNPALAKKSLNRALEFEPGNLFALYQLAYLDMWQGNPRQALKRYEAIQARHPFFENLQFNMGLAWRSLGEHRKAAESAAITCRIYPTFGPALLLLSRSLVELQEFDTALYWCDRLAGISFERRAVDELRSFILARRTAWLAAHPEADEPSIQAKPLITPDKKIH